MKNLFTTAPKTNASAILEHLNMNDEQKKQQDLMEDSIVLYPENESSIAQTIADNKLQENMSYASAVAFREGVQNTLMITAIFEGAVAPVLEMNLATAREKKLAHKTVSDYVLKEGYYNLLDHFKYKNYYLAEFAMLIDDYATSIISETEEQVKEGLSEKDAYTIENQKIDNFILNARDIVPKDITKEIQDRVQDSINDFVDENKANKFKIKEIYDNAKMKISQADGYDDIQQEALNYARAQERKLVTESETNLFGSIVKIMTESVIAIKSLKEAYMDTTDTGINKINFSKVVGDTTAIFTVMEAMNTLGIINADEDYVKNTVAELKQSMADTIDAEKLDPIKDDHEQIKDSDSDELPSDGDSAAAE